MSTISTIQVTDQYGAKLLLTVSKGMIEVQFQESDNVTRDARSLQLDETDRARLRDFLAVNS